MKIKVTDTAAVEATLEKVNGRSKTHTATASDVLRAAEYAEKELESLGVPKADRKGARYIFESGSKLPNCYKGSPNVNRIRIDRTSSGWIMTMCDLRGRTANHAPHSNLWLTEAQRDIAMAKLAKRFSVLPAAK
jgi:hypothetical protein